MLTFMHVPTFYIVYLNDEVLHPEDLPLGISVVCDIDEL